MTIVLMLLYMFSFLDRTIIVLLIEPIKHDLQLTDTQISLLYGFAFAIFYTLMGIPIARLADSRSRRNIIAAGVLVWSAMTALCGLARNFGMLFFARVGVGVGEAALSPAAYSLISDSFPEYQRPKAMSVYSMGLYMGVGVALLAGGLVIDFVEGAGVLSLPLVGELYSWQTTFLVAAAPGVLFVILVMALREPSRHGVGYGGSQGMPLREALGWFVQRKRFFLSFYLAMACLVFYTYSLNAWIPSFFIRTHGWSTLQVSQNYGVIVLLFGPVGIFAGGWLCSARAQGGDELANVRMLSVACIALLVPATTMTLVDSPWAALAIIAAIQFLSGLPLGVAMAGVHQVTPNHLRAQSAAIYFFVINLLGLGMGPTTVALLTDYVFGDPEALRYSMAIVGFVACALGFFLSLRATRMFRELKQDQMNDIAPGRRAEPAH
ncbi:MAG: MFS transporter [Halioglobus sp.]|nr:MFS transporter [Halioglobus sp.]